MVIIGKGRGRLNVDQKGVIGHRLHELWSAKKMGRSKSTISDRTNEEF